MRLDEYDPKDVNVRQQCLGRDYEDQHAAVRCAVEVERLRSEYHADPSSNVKDARSKIFDSLHALYIENNDGNYPADKLALAFKTGLERSVQNHQHRNAPQEGWLDRAAKFFGF